MFATRGVVTDIVVFCLNIAYNNAGLIACLIFFGFTQGTIISGGSAVFFNCPRDACDVGIYIGISMALVSIKALVRPLVNKAFCCNIQWIL